MNTTTPQTNTDTKAQGNIIERLFGAGAHFGFTKSRRHPTTAAHIFTNKQGTDLVDLEKTASSIDVAKGVLEEAGKNGKTILFVGTKEEISKALESAAKEVEMPYIAHRWVGGILTNFSEIKKRIQRLNDLIAQNESGELERKYTKKERVIIGREMSKLTLNFSGIQKMDRIPHALLVVDPRHDSIAVAEARELKIPIIAIGSTDTNLNLITYPIVANDALQGSVSLILAELCDAYKAGKAAYVPAKKESTHRRDA